MDYRHYHFSKKETAENLLLFLALDGCISYLFYRSVLVFVLGLFLVKRFFREREKDLCEKRKEKLAGEFLVAMQSVTTSLTAGYSVETAFEDALAELSGMYGEKDMILQEFRYIVSQLHMNRNLEELLTGLADRSGIEDIRNFAELFAVAKRSGGNLIAIIRSAVRNISRKEETRREIGTALSAKKMEQNMMSLIPCLILLYVQTVSPGFLDGMYHNIAGVTVMSLALAVYAFAYFWGKKIIAIEV